MQTDNATPNELFIPTDSFSSFVHITEQLNCRERHRLTRKVQSPHFTVEWRSPPYIVWLLRKYYLTAMVKKHKNYMFQHLNESLQLTEMLFLTFTAASNYLNSPFSNPSCFHGFFRKKHRAWRCSTLSKQERFAK